MTIRAFAAVAYSAATAAATLFDDASTMVSQDTTHPICWPCWYAEHKDCEGGRCTCDGVHPGRPSGGGAV